MPPRAGGLEPAEVAERRETVGENVVEETPPPRLLTVVVDQFRSPLIYILLIATAVTSVLQEYLDAAVIAAALLLNATIGTVQQRKAEASVRSLQQLLAPQANLVFSGTVVARGRGRGYVIATGGRTELGRIAEQIRTAESPVTPLQRQLGTVAKVIGLGVLGAALLAFMVGFALGQSAQDMFIVAVALAVSAIPESLAVVFTVVLAVGVTRMARRKAIVRQLAAVETLGSTTVICSDKTGTLTRNEMTVQEARSVGMPPRWRHWKTDRPCSCRAPRSVCWRCAANRCATASRSRSIPAVASAIHAMADGGLRVLAFAVGPSACSISRSACFLSASPSSRTVRDGGRSPRRRWPACCDAKSPGSPGPG